MLIGMLECEQVRGQPRASRTLEPTRQDSHRPERGAVEEALASVRRGGGVR